MKLNYNDKKLQLIQQPYLDGWANDAYYFALAQDGEGEEYGIRWEIIEGRLNNNEFAEDEMCDWTKYHVTPNF